MTQAAVRPRVSFEEYIDFCVQTEGRYELVRGALVKMTPPTWLHTKIAKFLEQTLDAAIEQTGYPWEAFRETGQQTESDSSRLPDVTVVPTAAIEQFLNQTAVLTVAAPLVIEIISPSSATEDYTNKLREYEALGISEYWTVDHEGLGAIAPALFQAAIALVTDTETFAGGEASCPIHEALNWHVTRFGYQDRETLYAALWLNADSSTWQAKLSRPCTDVNGKPQKYETPSGNGARDYLPPVPAVIRQRISDRCGVHLPSDGAF